MTTTKTAPTPPPDTFRDYLKGFAGKHVELELTTGKTKPAGVLLLRDDYVELQHGDYPWPIQIAHIFRVKAVQPSPRRSVPGFVHG
jgi:hypothetical protein